MTLKHLTQADKDTLGPKTCAYLQSENRDYAGSTLLKLTAMVLAERQGRLDTKSVLVESWQSFALVVLLGDALDYWKAGKLTVARADQYRAEARQAKLPSILLRLMAKLYHETNPNSFNDYGK